MSNMYRSCSEKYVWLLLWEICRANVTSCWYEEYAQLLSSLSLSHTHTTKLSLTRMSHVSHAWVMSHMCTCVMDHMSHPNEACRIRMSRALFDEGTSHKNESCLIRMSHVSHVHMRHGSHAWVMSHMCTCVMAHTSLITAAGVKNMSPNRSLSAKEPLIIGLFCGKRPIQTRHLTHLRCLIQQLLGSKTFHSTYPPKRVRGSRLWVAKSQALQVKSCRCDFFFGCVLEYVLPQSLRRCKWKPAKKGHTCDFFVFVLVCCASSLCCFWCVPEHVLPRSLRRCKWIHATFVRLG